MRSFLQKKAGATYFNESNVTANIRKNNFEYIFALSGGWHAVISVIPAPEGVILMACLDGISDELDRIVPSLRLKPGEHTKFTEILEGKSGYRLLNIDVEGRGKLEAGICKVLEGKRAPHLQLLGVPEIQIEAEKLCPSSSISTSTLRNPLIPLSNP